MNFTNNKSRPEQSFVFVDDDYKEDIQKENTHNTHISKQRRHRRKVSKPRKRTSPKPKSKSNKYIPGDYIYDTKGQMAVIKYIGQCHKGPGIWYGIEFVDGSLGKHNGTIHCNTYFEGADRRCDMIRANKIRSKALPNLSFSTKHTAKPMRSKHRRVLHKRAASDLSCMEKLSLAELSNTFSDGYYKKRKGKHKHKRTTSEIGNISDTASLNDVYFDRQTASKKDRNVLLFGSKSRDEKAIFRNGHRQYKSKGKQVKTVKKEKYKGNKYILAMEQETEKRKHERIGFIKMDKKRVKQEKHQRNSSKVQEILKRKELKKEEISKLNQRNRLKELQRIQAAKEKSKRRLKKCRGRSCSDYTNTLSKRRPNTRVNVAGNKHTGTNDTLLCTLSMISLGDDRSLRISSTPLTDLSVHASELSDLTSKSAKSMQIFVTECEGDDSLYGSMDDDDDDMDSVECILQSSYSDSDVLGSTRSKSRSLAMDGIFPVNKDSALLLQELLDQPMVPMSELWSSGDECPLAVPSHNIISMTPKRAKKKTVDTLRYPLRECEEREIESTSDIVRGIDFHLPIKQNKPRRSPLPGDCNALQRSDTVPLHLSDDHGTDYWIQQYNKVNKTWSDAQRKMKLRRTEDTGNQFKSSGSLTASKSVETQHLLQNKSIKQQDDTLYFPMSSKKAIKRSVSLSDTANVKRVDSAPMVCNDDKGTDYWIKQYNKSNKKKSDSKRKSKSKSKQKKVSSKKKVSSAKKRVKTSTNSNKSSPKTSELSIITPNFYDKLDNKHTDISPFNQFIRDDISDVPSSVFSDPSVATFDSITIASGSTISLMSSPSSSGSADSTPHASTCNNDVLPSYFNDRKDMNDMKYGGYPFKRKREQYINKKFTGIVRIGHRYLLRDGRIGVVRFINDTRFARGTWIGMELDNAEGEHNGIVHNVKYFECNKMYGTFVTLPQIAQYINRDITKSLSRNQLRCLNASK